MGTIMVLNSAFLQLQLFLGGGGVPCGIAPWGRARAPSFDIGHLEPPPPHLGADNFASCYCAVGEKKK